LHKLRRREGKEKKEIEKKDSNDTSKLQLQHQLYHLKYLDERNQMILKKITNSDQSVSHLPPKDGG
jgi:hypothetical protein